MSIEHFNHTIDTWIADLQRYSIDDLRAKPSPTSWSMGQLYKHLISETQFYISRMKVCVLRNRNSNKEMTPEGKQMFHNNSFPDERLQGGPSNSKIPQPVNKEELVEEFMDLRRVMNESALSMKETVFNGKAKHPGLGYLNASEWLQFADMHMRHHLRQKKRIDEYLISSR
ncbi:MAG TPA: DinB family protein [Chryseolinea sp.]|nr:DinB family protein [Chryseolinea sp.]